MMRNGPLLRVRKTLANPNPTGLGNLPNYIINSSPLFFFFFLKYHAALNIASQ